MLLAWFFAAAGLVAWWIQVQAPPAALACAASTLLASGIVAAHSWLRSPAGTLAWDGLGWTWSIEATAQSGTPEVALDAQGVLLLRWLGDSGKPQWLWLERATRPVRWDDFRRAVYSRASPP